MCCSRENNDSAVKLFHLMLVNSYLTERRFFLNKKLDMLENYKAKSMSLGVPILNEHWLYCTKYI